MKFVLYLGFIIWCSCFILGCEAEKKTEDQASAIDRPPALEVPQEPAGPPREKFSLVSMMEHFCGLDSLQARSLRRFFSDRVYQLEHIAFPLDYRRTDSSYFPDNMVRDRSQFRWQAHNWEFLIDEPFDTSGVKFECSRSDTGFALIYGIPNSDVFGELKFKLNDAREPVLVYYSSTFSVEAIPASRGR